MNYDAASKIADASLIIGYQFINRAWLWEALQAAGSPVLGVPDRRFREGNKRLAGLGDRILSMIIVKRAVGENISIGSYISNPALHITPVLISRGGF